MRTTPGEIAVSKMPPYQEDTPARQWLRMWIGYPGTADGTKEYAKELLAATAPLTNEDLAEIMADYCVDVLKVETDRAQIVASYMRDMESADGHSYGRMARYLADRLFGHVTP